MIVVHPGEISDPLLEFISIKDPHLNFGFANRIRYSHEEDMKSKTEFIRKWCKDHKIYKILFTGDLVDTNEERKWSFNQYVDNKNELLKFKEQGIKLWSVAGNHDMFNGMAQTTKTVFGEFVREDVINYLTINPLVQPFNDQNGIRREINIYGVDYSKHKENVMVTLKDINDHKEPSSFTAVVFHAHCTPAEIAVTDFTYENLLKTYPNIDLFICGHYHGGFPTGVYYKEDGQQKDHVTIINNWSMQRVVRDYYNEMDVHTPEFEHVKIGWSVAINNFIMARETIKIPCKSYVETFKPKAVELLKLTKKEQFEFFEKINFDDIPTGNDDFETIRNISEKDGVTAEVVALAINYLNNVKSEDIELDQI